MEVKEIDSQKSAHPLMSLYNFIKTLSGLPLEEALEKIQDYETQGGDCFAVSSKGSNALHVCAYIKRWDIAKFFLEKGISALEVNKAGHSFLKLLRQEKGQDFSAWKEQFPSLDSQPMPVQEYEREVHQAPPNRKKSHFPPRDRQKKSVEHSEIMTAEELEQKIALEQSVLDLALEKKWGSLGELLQEVHHRGWLWQKGTEWVKILEELNKEEIVELLHYSEYFEKKSFLEYSLFTILIEKKKECYFNMFMGHGFDINAINSSGSNALDEALLRGDLDAVEWLCGSGAKSIGAKAIFGGMSAIDYAQKNCSLDIVEMLQESIKEQDFFVDKKNNKKTKPKVPKKGSNGKKTKGIFVARLESNLKEAGDYQELRPNDTNAVIIIKKKRSSVLREKSMDTLKLVPPEE